MGLFNFREKKVTMGELCAILKDNLDRAVFRELAIHIAISYIANTLSKCEFKVYERGEEVRNPLYYKLNVSPNPNENSSQFINHFVENYFYGDDGALLVKHGDHLYCADNFEVDDADPTKEFVYSTVTLGSTSLRRKFRASEVFHLKLDNRNVRTLVDAVNTEYGKVIDAAIKCFKRTNNKKYKYILDQYQAGDANFKKVYEEVLKGQLAEFLQSDGDAVLPKYDGIDLVEFSAATPQTSADIVSVRKEMFEVTAQAFKIPLSMLLGSITNMNEIVKVYLSICIDPLADMISEELTRKSYDEKEWLAGSYVKVDTSCINHVDILEVADNVAKLLGSGFTLDELRNRLNYSLLNTEFSKTRFITKNYETLGAMTSGQRGGEME